MFRYSKYFILLFLAVTILPLVLMFSLHHHQTQKMHIRHSQNILKMGATQLRQNVIENINKADDIEDYDVQSLFPSGPFVMELYRGDKIIDENFIKSATDKYAPHFTKRHQRNHLGIPSSREESHVIVPVYGDEQKIKALFLLKIFGHPKPPVHIIWDFGGVIIVLSVISSLVMGLYMKNTFLTPLIKLSAALKNLQKGDFDSKVLINSSEKEVAQVFDNFNDVTNALKEKEELRTNFISNLTHDLRTPLIAQERTLELISKEFEELGLQEAYGLSKSLEKNNQHLLRMVNLILEAYRFDVRDLKLYFSDENIHQIISDCFSQLEVLANEKNITLQNDIPFNSPTVYLDRNCINRVFINIVSNAIANTPNGGLIKVYSGFVDDFVEIIVEDNGNGIAQGDLKHIFDRYYVGKGYERNIGSGLGLYVCKELIGLHSGDISVSSQSGEFTKFVIKLPLNKKEEEV